MAVWRSSGAGLAEAGAAGQAVEKTAAETTSAAQSAAVAAPAAGGNLVLTLALAENGEVTKAELQTA
ncbi:MAG: hypothetical protein ACKOU6_07265, partial [Planctomycetota bacterium]